MEGRGRQPAIGIDLGTSYSCAAVWRNNQIEIIANDQGDRTTPSWVAFTETHRYIGEGAKQQAIRNYQNTVFDVKRLIGKRFSDPSVQHDLHNWPFKVISGEGDKPMIVVLYKFERKEFCPEEISSFVLSKMVDIAQAFLDSPVKDIVVTVPAYFDDQQRQATIDAGKIAGLNVMAIMNEPTAAAMAYGFDKKPDSQILIFDLGGGTFDISIAEVKGGTIKVIATTGDTHLGGLDFNNNMVDYFVEEIKTKHNEDIRGNTKALGKLRARCERAKRTLSVLTQADIEIDSLVADFDFCSSITRAQFEDINMHLFKKCMHTVEECLRDANMDKSNIDDVVLVGGSTKIPMIQSMLQEFFNGKVLSKGINPDEAVAYGAALKAAYLSNNKVQDMVLQDVTPLSFGTDIRGGLVDVVIPRNTSIPTKKEKLYCTTVDNQPWMPLEVYMGEGRYIKDCKLLEKLTFTGIPPAPKGQSTITVTFEIDTDGILTVSAVDNTNGGNRMEVTIANDQGRLTSEEIGRMVKDAEKYNADDQNHMINVKAKNELETVIINLEKCMLEDDDVGSENKATIQSLIEPIRTWLKSNELVDGDKFRLEYEEHVALLSNAVENIPNNSRSEESPTWSKSRKALRYASKIFRAAIDIANLLVG